MSRITELPRTGSLTRDVLVDLEETNTTTVDYGGGVEVGRIAATSDEATAPIDKLDIGAARLLFNQPAQPVGQEPIDHAVRARHAQPARAARRQSRPDRYRRLRVQRYRGLFTFREPRAFGTTGDAQFTAFIEQGRRSSFTFNRRGVTADYARRISAFTFTGRYTFDYTKLFDEQIAPEDQLLIDRLFPQVKLSKVFGGVLRDSRDDVLDPQRGAVVGVDGTVARRFLAPRSASSSHSCKDSFIAGCLADAS